LPKKFEARTSYGEITAELTQAHIGAPSAKDISNAVCRIRQRKLPDPKLIGNAGSFFKNPIISTDQLTQLKKNHSDVLNYGEDSSQVKIPAAWLIEKSGWKGKCLGNACIHERHALVLINREDKASGAEILALARAIQTSVKNEFDILLEPEPIII
jgi:UDP-N-acetylmuramate dehydrogenase